MTGRIILTIILSLSYFSIISAQQRVQFYAGWKGNFTSTSNFEHSDNISAFGIADTFNTIERYNSIVTGTLSYSQPLNWLAGVDASYQLSNKLNITTGIGFHANRVSFEESMRETQFGELISIDTLSTVSTGSSASFCSIYLNSPDDLSQYSRAHDILSLRIPLQVDYSVMNDKLRLGVNTFLQTPIYSSYKYGVIRVTRVIADDEIICTYNSVEFNQRNGEALNQLIYGMGINAEYSLSHKWNIRMSVNKVMRSILYSDGQSRYFQHKSHNLVPIEWNLTMGYVIYEAKKLAEPISIMEGPK